MTPDESSRIHGIIYNLSGGLEGGCNPENPAGEYMVQGFFGVRMWFTIKDGGCISKIVVSANSGLKDRTEDAIAEYIGFTKFDLYSKLLDCNFIVHIDDITFK
jgi:hypothetical protein